MIYEENEMAIRHLVKELREATGAGMMDKKALTETDGDFEAAVDWLRTKRPCEGCKKSGRVSAKGWWRLPLTGQRALPLRVNSKLILCQKRRIPRNG